MTTEDFDKIKKSEITVQEVINSIIVPELNKDETVDKLVLGDENSLVKGIGVTFLATQEVIEKSIELGVNLIITHEGIFYSHRNNTKIFEDDSVFKNKLNLIESHNISIFRFHDSIHRYNPDGIMVGLLKKLSWEKYEIKQNQIYSIIEIPSNTLLKIIEYIRKTLNVNYVRFIGNLTMECNRIGILVGYRGTGEIAIPLFDKENVDTLIYGEGPEWETPEYVRDAIIQGKKRGLIVLGHAESEKFGMEYAAHVIKEKFPYVPVHYFSQPSVFKIC